MKKKSKERFIRPALCSIALALSLSVSGCGLSDMGTIRMGSADVGTKIYVIGQTKNQEFWNKVQQGATEAGEEFGYEVVYSGVDSIADIENQKKLIHEAINAGASTIVIAPVDPDGLNKDLQQAVDAGIEVVTIDSDTSFSGRRAYIGTINAASGAIAARQAAAFFTDLYKDKVLIVSESETALATSDRLGGFIPALVGQIRGRAGAEYAQLQQQQAQEELAAATDIPDAALNPARSAAQVAAAAGAPAESIARAVANATANSSTAGNVDPQVAARAAKLATDSVGGDGDLAAKLTYELMTGETLQEENENEQEPVYDNSEEVTAKVNAAAMAAAKEAASKGADAAAIAEAACNAAVESALELGAGPGTAAKAAGQAAGTNGGDAMAASSAAAAAVDKASKEKLNQGGAGEGGAPQQGGEAQGNAQQGGAPQQGGPDASVEVPAELAEAAQQAAKTAAAQGAPAAAIAQAAANAAATTAIKIGASPAAAGQAAGQAAGMNGGDGQLAGSTAAQAVIEAMAENGGEQGEGGEEQKPEEGQKPEGTQQPTTISGGSPLDAISPVHKILGCKGDSESAKAQIIQTLSSKDGENVKVIFCTSERSTIGACEAISDLGLIGKVAIIGYNASDDELTYLKNGTLSGLMIQNPYNMGYLGVYYAGRLIAGENVSEMIDTGSTYATLNNLNSNEIQLLLNPAEYTKK